MNDDIERWLDRIQTLMDVQKFEGIELISANFSRADLISLSVLLGSLKELKEKNYEFKKRT